MPAAREPGEVGTGRAGTRPAAPTLLVKHACTGNAAQGAASPMSRTGSSACRPLRRLANVVTLRTGQRRPGGAGDPGRPAVMTPAGTAGGLRRGPGAGEQQGDVVARAGSHARQ